MHIPRVCALRALFRNGKYSAQKHKQQPYSSLQIVLVFIPIKLTFFFTTSNFTSFCWWHTTVRGSPLNAAF